jgi:hypothetical protein
VPCPHPLRPSQKERQGRPTSVPPSNAPISRKCRPAHCAWWCMLDRCSRSPLPELAGYWSSPPGRLWPPVTLCFKCFRRFRLMFQVFNLNVANRSRMLHMLQAYVLSVSGVSDICFKYFI